jgi:hypothetical protein
MKQAADITIILDRSGSMESIASDVVGGFNHFIAAQRAQPGDCRLTLVQFDDQYEVVYAEQPVADAPLLTSGTFQPRGTTALLDAVGRTIDATGHRLRGLPETDRPDRVLMVIITDGLENASTRYTRARVFEMISTQRDVYRWGFLFLAGNQDAIQEGGHIGIAPQAAMTFAADGASYRRATLAMSDAVSAFRQTGEAEFSPPSAGARVKKKRVH